MEQYPAGHEQFNNKEISIGRAYVYMQSYIDTLKFGMVLLVERISNGRGNNEDQKNHMRIMNLYKWSVDISLDSALTEFEKFSSLAMKVAVHYLEKDFNEAEKCLDMCRGIGEGVFNVLPEHVINNVVMVDVCVKREVLKGAELLEYHKTAINREGNNLFEHWTHLIEIGRAIIQIDKSKGYEYLRIKLDELKLLAKSFPPREFSQLIGLIGLTFYDYGYHVDVRTMEM